MNLLKRVILITILIFIIGISVYSFLLPTIQKNALPGKEAISRLAIDLAKNFKSSDILRVEPEYITYFRKTILKNLNIEQKPPFIWFDERRNLDFFFYLRFKRLFVVEVSSLSNFFEKIPDEFKDILVLRMEKKYSKNLRLLEFDILSPEIKYDFLKNLGKALVRRNPPGKKGFLCKWNGVEHHCSGEAWKNVKIMKKDVGDARRVCIFVEPYPSNSETEIEFKDVPKGRFLVLQSGFSIEGVRRTAGSDVIFSVFVNGKKVHSHVEKKNVYAWHKNIIFLSGFENNKFDIIFKLKIGVQGWRQLCFDALLF